MSSLLLQYSEIAQTVLFGGGRSSTSLFTSHLLMAILRFPINLGSVEVVMCAGSVSCA